MLFFAKRHKSLAAEMRLFMLYFSMFDGAPNAWENRIRDVADRTFHDDLIVEEEGASYNKVEFMEKLRSFVEAGGYMQVHKLKEHPQGLGIQYHVTFHKKEGGKDGETSSSFTTKSFGMFQNGKLVRVQRDHVRKPNTIL